MTVFFEIDKAALDAINVYHAACYYGFPIESISDALTQSAYNGIIRTYGQVPKVNRRLSDLCVHARRLILSSNCFVKHIRQQH